MQPSKLLLIFALLPVTFMAGCAAKNSSVMPPNSPQSTVALTVNTVADTAQVGVQTVIALRDAGKLSQATTVTIENWLGFVATTDKAIGAILQKPETWAQQKAEIYLLLATVTAPTMATTIDPGAQAVVAQVMTLVNQIKTQVVP